MHQWPLSKMLKGQERQGFGVHLLSKTVELCSSDVMIQEKKIVVQRFNHIRP